MSLADVTAEGVSAAIAEFDRLGRDPFLRSTGFSRSRAYYLEQAGHLYDSKAIVGYAHGVSTGTTLGPSDFSGGDQTVAQRLRGLGFTVHNLLVAWTQDEIILACALAEASGWKYLDARDRRVQELSGLLQSPVIHPAYPRHPDFRNPAGVARKIGNILSVHPDFRGTPSNGNRLDKEVLDEFLADPSRMRDLAARISELLAGSAAQSGAMPDLDDEDGVGEGGVALRAYLRRERDPELRRRKIAATKGRGLPVACEVCTFDFSQVYGSHGLDYIECHHRVPLHVTGETKTRLADLALLCSNCHRMIHRAKKWLTVDEHRDLVSAQRAVHSPAPGSLASADQAV
jgi:5-methylcytosine-specific restriction enzyme A